jgi:hypothetical protein
LATFAGFSSSVYHLQIRFAILEKNVTRRLPGESEVFFWYQKKEKGKTLTAPVERAKLAQPLVSG